MKELLARVFSRPIIAVELIVASLFINVLALASPLFVMQVLRRYVSGGVDATLATLVSGVALAIVLEFVFRQVRVRLARGISVTRDEKAAILGFGVLTKAKASALDQIPPETRREMVNGAAAIESAYNANNITTVLDVPFALVFVLVLYIMKPVLALIAACFLVGVFVLGVLGSLSLHGKTTEAQNAAAAGSALLGTATREQETVRCFNAGGFLRRAWHEHTGHVQRLRRDIVARQALVQSVTQSATGLMSVVIISVGAVLAVIGEFDVGAMIGANILAARAMQPVTKFAQLGAAFAKARQALELLRKLSTVPLEPESGSALSSYKGGVEFRDMAFAYPGATTPLFESMNLKLEPGSILVVVGNNGTGKTTLARLLVGLLNPIRGNILVDGLDLQQVAPEWWRRQVIYLPQEPALLNASIEENLRINNPDLDGPGLNNIISAVGLRRFLDESPQGLGTPIVDNGWRLSEGTRRRIALARALATSGMLAIIDEPTESLDADGVAAVHAILAKLVQKGRTVIVMSHHRDVVKGGHILLDLNAKPVPEVVDRRETVPSDIGRDAEALS